MQIKLRKYTSLPVATGRNTAQLLNYNGSPHFSNGTNFVSLDRIFIQYRAILTSSLVTTECFFIAPRAIEILVLKEVHSAAGSNGAATWTVTKDVVAGTVAPGAGTSILTAAQLINTAANTTITPALSATASVLKMAAGDRLSALYTGTLTAFAGVIISIEARVI